MTTRLFSRLQRMVVAGLFGAATIAAIGTAPTVSAAACTAPSTDYGTVTYTTSIATAGSYRVWVRMSAPSASVNTVMVDIDSSTCYTVGGASVPVYSSGTSTYFANNTTNWINRTSSGTVVAHSFSAASHTIKHIGTGADVVVDRVIITADDTCVPTGAGDNCSMIYVAPDIDMNGKVDFLDFSRLASKYGQTSGTLGRTDINNDGTVNFLDYSALASKYGQ